MRLSGFVLLSAAFLAIQRSVVKSEDVEMDGIGQYARLIPQVNEYDIAVRFGPTEQRFGDTILFADPKSLEQFKTFLDGFSIYARSKSLKPIKQATVWCPEYICGNGKTNGGLAPPNPDVRVSHAEGAYPYVVGPGYCSPGAYIYLPYSILTSDGAKVFGKPGMIFLALWLEYRYGVPPDHGFPGHSMSPLVIEELSEDFKSATLRMNACTDSGKIMHKYSTERFFEGSNCRSAILENKRLDFVNPLRHCRIRDTQNVKNQRPSNETIPSLTQTAFPWEENDMNLCNESTHSFHRPSSLSLLCPLKSQMEIIKEHQDSLSQLSPKLLTARNVNFQEIIYDPNSIPLSQNRIFIFSYKNDLSDPKRAIAVLVFRLMYHDALAIIGYPLLRASIVPGSSVDLYDNGQVPDAFPNDCYYSGVLAAKSGLKYSVSITVPMAVHVIGSIAPASWLRPTVLPSGDVDSAELEKHITCTNKALQGDTGATIPKSHLGDCYFLSKIARDLEYFKYYEGRKFKNPEGWCHVRGAGPISVRSLEDDAFLNTYFKTNFPNQAVEIWLAGVRIPPRPMPGQDRTTTFEWGDGETWVWADKHPPWCHNEPNNLGGTENYMNKITSGVPCWNDLNGKRPYDTSDHLNMGCRFRGITNLLFVAPEKVTATPTNENCPLDYTNDTFAGNPPDPRVVSCHVELKRYYQNPPEVQAVVRSDLNFDINTAFPFPPKAVTMKLTEGKDDKTWDLVAEFTPPRSLPGHGKSYKYSLCCFERPMLADFKKATQLDASKCCFHLEADGQPSQEVGQTSPRLRIEKKPLRESDHTCHHDFYCTVYTKNGNAFSKPSNVARAVIRGYCPLKLKEDVMHEGGVLFKVGTEVTITCKNQSSYFENTLNCNKSMVLTCNDNLTFVPDPDGVKCSQRKPGEKECTEACQCERSFVPSDWITCTNSMCTPKNPDHVIDGDRVVVNVCAKHLLPSIRNLDEGATEFSPECPTENCKKGTVVTYKCRPGVFFNGVANQDTAKVTCEGGPPPSWNPATPGDCYKGGLNKDCVTDDDCPLDSECKDETSKKSCQCIPGFQAVNSTCKSTFCSPLTPGKGGIYIPPPNGNEPLDIQGHIQENTTLTYRCFEKHYMILNGILQRFANVRCQPGVVRPRWKPELDQLRCKPIVVGIECHHSDNQAEADSFCSDLIPESKCSGNGTCACADWTEVSSDGTQCVPKNKTCKDPHMQNANLQCDPTDDEQSCRALEKEVKIVCKEGYYILDPETGKYTHQVKVKCKEYPRVQGSSEKRYLWTPTMSFYCTPIPLHGPCRDHTDCKGNEMCDPTSKTCVCNKGFQEMGNLCEKNPESIPTDGCTLENLPEIPNAGKGSINATTKRMADYKCNDSFVYEGNRQKEFNIYCFSADGQNHKGQWETVDKACVPVTIGDVCDSAGSCRGEHSKCANGVCICKDGFDPNSDLTNCREECEIPSEGSGVILTKPELNKGVLTIECDDKKKHITGLPVQKAEYECGWNGDWVPKGKYNFPDQVPVTCSAIKNGSLCDPTVPKEDDYCTKVDANLGLGCSPITGTCDCRPDFVDKFPDPELKECVPAKKKCDPNILNIKCGNPNCQMAYYPVGYNTSEYFGMVNTFVAFECTQDGLYVTGTASQGVTFKCGATKESATDVRWYPPEPLNMSVKEIECVAKPDKLGDACVGDVDTPQDIRDRICDSVVRYSSCVDKKCQCTPGTAREKVNSFGNKSCEPVICEPDMYGPIEHVEIIKEGIYYKDGFKGSIGEKVNASCSKNKYFRGTKISSFDATCESSHHTGNLTGIWTWNLTSDVTTIVNGMKFFRPCVTTLYCDDEFPQCMENAKCNATNRICVCNEDYIMHPTEMICIFNICPRIEDKNCTDKNGTKLVQKAVTKISDIASCTCPDDYVNEVFPTQSSSVAFCVANLFSGAAEWNQIQKIGVNDEVVNFTDFHACIKPPWFVPQKPAVTRRLRQECLNHLGGDPGRYALLSYLLVGMSHGMTLLAAVIGLTITFVILNVYRRRAAGG